MVNCYAGLSERKFRKWAQMDANTPLCHSERLLCHSEHSEESREGKGKEIHRSALNDKLVVNAYAWYTVSECNGHPNANFANGRKSTQITVFVIPNTSSCHSEHREESRGEKGRDSSLRSE